MADATASPEARDDATLTKGSSVTDPNAGCIVHIRNIPAQVDEFSLNQVMRHFGKVRQCRIIIADDPQSPAEAYVLFKRPSEAESALKADGKLDCGGCPLKITLWKGPFPSEEALKACPARQTSGRDECWFCLSNSQCESHMIAFISDHSYIAIAKGALAPQHSLVAPIYHYPSAASAPFDVLKDLQRLVDCLLDICLKSGMGGIAFERYMPMQNPLAMHTQIQVVPVPLDRAIDAFSYVNSSDYFSGSRIEPLDPNKATSLTSLENRLDTLDRSYFYLQAVGRDSSGTPGLVHSHCLWSLGHKGCARRIPITFGREMVLSILPDTAASSMPHLRGSTEDPDWRQTALDWRNCVIDKGAETEMTKALMKNIAEGAK